LDAAALTIRFSLALWVGGTLLVVIAAPVVFGRIASRDAAGGVFGEILRRFEIVKQVLSLALVIGVFVTLERGGRLEGTAVAAAVAIFVAVATNVYLAMVLRPRMGYFREKVGSFDAVAAAVRPAAPSVDPRPGSGVGGRGPGAGAVALTPPVRGPQARRTAMASISMAAPLGSSDTATVERAGRWFPNRRP
jgi:hypothetical protein